MYIYWLAIGDAGQYLAIMIADDESDDGDPRWYRLGGCLCRMASTSALRPSPLRSIR
jgi:hypothetical protein